MDRSVALIGATVVCLIASNVIVYNVFDADIAWTTDFCELLMVWVTFLGCASATRRGAHMVIGELLDRLSPASRQGADAAIQRVVLLTLGLLFWYGIGIAEAGRLSVLTVLGWPVATPYAAQPVASSLTMIFAAWDLVEILRGRPREERHGERHR